MFVFEDRSGAIACFSHFSLLVLQDLFFRFSSIFGKFFCRCSSSVLDFSNALKHFFFYLYKYSAEDFVVRWRHRSRRRPFTWYLETHKQSFQNATYSCQLHFKLIAMSDSFASLTFQIQLTLYDSPADHNMIM